MVSRRQFMQSAWLYSLALFGLSRCGRDSRRIPERESPLPFLAADPMQEESSIILYDTYAMALYLDGTMGPKTGIITAQAVLDGIPLRMKFWHGHNGKDHFFTLDSTQLGDIRAQKKVYAQTDLVASHSHKLFVDMSDPRWRVPGSVGIPLPKKE